MISETTELVYWHVTRREEDDKVVKVPRTDRDAYTKNKEEKRPTTGWAERYELSVMLAASLGNIGPYWRATRTSAISTGLTIYVGSTSYNGWQTNDIMMSLLQPLK